MSSYSDDEIPEAQDSYPYYVDEGSDIDEDDFSNTNEEVEKFSALTLESPVLPDVKHLWEAAHLCVKDYNSQEGKNWAFVRIIKAERMKACGGYIYLLVLAVKNHKGEETQIVKFVWKGALLQVISTTEEMITPEQKQATVNLKQGYKLGLAAALFHRKYGNSRRHSLRMSRVIEYEETANSGLHTKKGEGYIDYSFYRVSAVAIDLQRNDYEFIIQGDLRRSKWVLPVNEEMSNSLLNWLKSVRDLHDPPLVLNYLSDKYPGKNKPRPKYLNDLDLTSPQIVTQAWFAVENYNFEKNTNLKFVKVERAAKSSICEIYYELFITVMDGLSPKTFATEVLDTKYASLWICISELVPYEEPLGKMVQVDVPRYA